MQNLFHKIIFIVRTLGFVICLIFVLSLSLPILHFNVYFPTGRTRLQWKITNLKRNFPGNLMVYLQMHSGGTAFYQEQPFVV